MGYYSLERGQRCVTSLVYNTPLPLHYPRAPPLKRGIKTTFNYTNDGNDFSSSVRILSYWAGSFKPLPNSATGSSTEKPGLSVASSNNTEQAYIVDLPV